MTRESSTRAEISEFSVRTRSVNAAVPRRVKRLSPAVHAGIRSRGKTRYARNAKEGCVQGFISTAAHAANASIPAGAPAEFYSGARRLTRLFPVQVRLRFSCGII